VNVSHTPGTLKKFYRTPWRFQATFHTPLNDLDRFVGTILSTDADIEQAVVTIGQVVFEPKHLLSFFSGDAKPPPIEEDCSLAATSRQEVLKLLTAAFADWIDFAFVPSPKPFVSYADHDEYATFFSNTKSNLNLMVPILAAAGFRQIANWQRNFD
jgi:hypothetical protein